MGFTLPRYHDYALLNKVFPSEVSIQHTDSQNSLNEPHGLTQFCVIAGLIPKTRYSKELRTRGVIQLLTALMGRVQSFVAS